MMDCLKKIKFLSNFKDKGKIIVGAEIAYDDEILQVAKYWLPFIKIVEPLNLRDKFENLLRDYLK